MSHMMAMMEMMHRQMMPMDMGMAGMQPVQHIDGQIAFYKAELKITDAQSPQWNAFADALRGSATRLHQSMAHGTDAKDVVTAPERMQRRITMLTAQLDAGQAILAAANPLYAVLTDEQKKVADELMTERMTADAWGIMKPSRSSRDRVTSHPEQGGEVGLRHQGEAVRDKA